MVQSVFDQVLIAFLLMLVGMAGYRFGLISDETNKQITNLVLAIASPALILSSYQIEFSEALSQNIIYSLLVAVGVHLILIIGADCVIKKKNKEWRIEKFSLIYTNCGFIGIPLGQAIFGSEGVIYVTSYITVFNILLWTHGYLLMSGKKLTKHTLKKIVFNPALIAVVVGMLTYVLQIKFPFVVDGTLKHLGNLNTPLAMMTAGVSVMQAGLGQALQNRKLFKISFLRLLVFPVIVFLMLKAIPITVTVKNAILLCTACPTGATGIMFAIKYGKNDAYASHIFSMTTALSLITLPVVSFCCTYFG